MQKNRLAKLLILCSLVVALVTTSFGGALATAAYAATSDQAESTVEDKDQKMKDVLTGVLAVGLIAALANGGDDDKESTPAKTSTGNTTTTPSKPSSGSVSAAQQQALSLLNADRAKNGLPALKLNSQLTRLAGDYAQDMINRNFFSHYNPEGQSPFDRMNEYGISYSHAGENLAINSSVAGAEAAFMNSSGHRANILNSSYTEVGIGVRYDANGSVYVVQEFIRP